MIRAFADELVLFLLPFAAFALFLLLRRRNPLTLTPWQGRVPWLVLAGLGLAALSLLATGFLEKRHLDAYVPPHMEGGRLVPGEFR